MAFYDDSVTGEGLQQGDILSRVVFHALSVNNASLIEPNSNRQQEVDLTNREVPKGSRAVVSIDQGPGMILNQTCDLTGNQPKPILIARVLPCESRLKNFPSNLEPLKRIERIKVLASPGKTPSLLYLPPYESEPFSLPRSVADLLEVAVFPPTNRVSLQKLIMLRLKPEPLKCLQERLAYCFGRFAAADDLYFDDEEKAAIESQRRASG